MSQVRHRRRQDALHQLYQLEDDDETIAARPDEPPLEELLASVAAVMCDIDLWSIRVINRVADNYQSTCWGLTNSLRLYVDSTTKKRRRDYDILNSLSLSGNFSRRYFSDKHMAEYLRHVIRIMAHYLAMGTSAPAATYTIVGLAENVLAAASDLPKVVMQMAGKCDGLDLEEEVWDVMSKRLMYRHGVQTLVNLEQEEWQSKETWVRDNWVDLMSKNNVPKDKGSESVDHLPQARKSSNWTSSLAALTGIITPLALIPTYFAWSHSPHGPGSTTDADFWWLIQSSTMTLLSIILLCPSIHNILLSQNRFWSWTFTITAIIATILAPILYVCAPTAWSGIMVFVGNACQAFAVLQQSLVSTSKEKEKVS